ncbi:response regulators consisting of a CheY-like receiver domain and a winged-helix DNA-binding domain [Longilinea arvoryzae]|uniref:Response regulators consisting of a CheY-like receiver domain and a winged-helix DNA-binding domain n=1 Tax=Longilinea arvoryzae TaxID=360412 RepID=A0A0S7BMK1_9CHLR|nr:response regulator transcription factor [Longilinea arvoryzae]GAP15243.1 response regulators consisting of a CheY-like receiver domain and a winged-helix DNA-binding domain [Longilinea arvoryzae]
MPEKILVVDDEISLLETLAYNLQKQGYEVETAGDGLNALTLAQSAHPDLIVLDLMLPGMDGFEVCRELRKTMNTPVLILTARDDEIDRVVGLEVGADDYLTKPFSMREFLARVKALLRRVRMIREELTSAAQQTGSTLAPGNSLIYGSLVIDLSRHEVRLRDQALALKPKEYELLVYFAQHQGVVLSRDLILENVWGWDFTGDSRTVDVHMRWLREKIEEDPSNPTRLITVRGAGYRFEG